jgi:hypothetical protein
MNFLKQNKTVIGVCVAAVAALVIYVMYFSGGSSATLSSSSSVSTASQNILVTLQDLNTIKLDDSIFTNPVFLSLTDFGVTIPLENVGRSDPFAPLAGVSLKTGLTLPTGTP